MNTGPENPGRSAQRRLARTAILLAGASAAVLLGVALDRGVILLVAVAVGVVLVVASAYWFLAHRGLVRSLALVLLVLTPLALALMLVEAGLGAAVLVAVGFLAGGYVSGKAALARDSEAEAMPEYDAPPPRRPFVVMNPRSGGGKVGRFRLKERAEALGAEVAMLDGPEPVDVTALAQDAVARGADLLGAAGGDGTQALVAEVAAEHHLPFMVVSAGTRNHFALDLGLDRDDPAGCLGALTDQAVELHVDLGTVAGRTFVNNASFGAYAAVVQSPAYRDDKAHTTLDLLPDLLSGHAGPRLTARVDGTVIDHPQAVLVSDNPYGTGDVAGLGRRARLDGGVLGVVAVSADNAREAVALLRRRSNRGLTTVAVPEVVVMADSPMIPVGVDGEAVLVPTPVRCSIRPKALRVRVPRDRPGVPGRRPALSWTALWRLAFSSLEER